MLGKVGCWYLTGTVRVSGTKNCVLWILLWEWEPLPAEVITHCLPDISNFFLPNFNHLSNFDLHLFDVSIGRFFHFLFLDFNIEGPILESVSHFFYLGSNQLRLFPSAAHFVISNYLFYFFALKCWSACIWWCLYIRFSFSHH